jgi:hypothetical protein
MRRPEELTEEEKRRTCELYQSGRPLREVWTEMRLTQMGIRQVLKDGGVHLRPQGCPRKNSGPKVKRTPRGKVSSIALGLVIHQLRLEARWELPILARAMGIHATRLYSYEKGRVIPSEGMIAHLEALFGVPTGFILRKAQTGDFPFCTIPSQRARELLFDEGTCPTMFCCYCVDARDIPAECQGLCQPARADFAKCPEPVRAKCPCCSPATAERKRAFKKFMEQRQKEEELYGRQRMEEEAVLEEA